MKRVLCFLILLAMLPAVAMAEHVESARAQQAAKTFFNNNGVNANKLTDLSAEAGFTNLYIYNADKGFVVMAADDRVQPVLGYSLTGSFDPDAMPDNVRAWLQGYDDEIKYVVESNAKATPETKQQWQDLENGVRGTKATVVVEPLIQTFWDQGDPYNQLCPTVSGTATYTGCVATAMAQVMKYWNWPIKGNSSKNYRWNNQTLSANFGNTTYDWANMTNTYDENSTEAQQTAVATLMYHCGVSVSMDYGTDGSGAYSTDVAGAMTTYFRYNSSISYKTKQSNSSNWLTLLKTDLDAGRPVYYSGSGSGGGHAFVCDGYDSNNYFHFNWGWSGMYDGYFLVNNLNPGTGGAGSGSSGTYNSSQAAIFGIQPTYSNINAPTLNATLVQNVTQRDVNISWNTVSGASKYQLFRNSVLIYEGTSTSFSDVTVPYGSNRYYVRCVNSSNGISQNSNVAEISISFPAPENFVATNDEDLFGISWDASDLAVSYNVYCNDMLIGSGLTSTAYTFTLSVYGDLSLYVRGVDFNGELSEISDATTLYQEFKGPLVDLTATLEGEKATITWDGLESGSYEIEQLNGYDGSIWISSLGTTGAYWAIRFPVSQMSFYAGMAMTSVETYIYEAGTYQVSIYQGTSNDAPAGSALATVSGTYSSNAGWKTLTFSNPVFLDYTKDLWIVYYSSNVTNFLLADMENEYGDYYSLNGSTWNHATGCTWIIYAVVTDGDYTYNLYRNGECIAQNLTDTTYVDQGLVNNAAYKYTVRTNYFGRESADSNFYRFVLGTASTDEAIEMERKDTLVLKQNSCFTVNAHLSNRRPGNLIIENGAQLIANDGVAVTIQKDLPASWNWWAPNVTADDLFAQLKTTLGGDAVLINSQGSGFVCYENNQWNGTLADVALGQMYKIWMDCGRSITMVGTTTSGVEFTIAPGNNWLGCPTTRNVSLAELDFVPTDGDTISSSTQSAVYQNGAWTGTLTTLQPGHGYIYVSVAQEDKTLRF